MFYLSHSQEETKQFACEFVSKLSIGSIIALEGDLGSGKTTFVQGLAEALGIKEPVRSPSFSLMNIYEFIGINQEKNFFVHVDAYRLDEKAKLEDIGLDEWLDRKEAIVLIEWPQRFEFSVIFDWKIIFSYGGEENMREILIRHVSSQMDTSAT
jgi:tRNA threonylcarbamoyladenosine biosynthesis protein TsaE